MHAVKDLLKGIGEDPEREGLRDTPKVSEFQTTKNLYPTSLLKRRASFLKLFQLPRNEGG